VITDLWTVRHLLQILLEGRRDASQPCYLNVYRTTRGYRIHLNDLYIEAGVLVSKLSQLTPS
jgi:hypothetical protein